jgi:hypothetical protein
MQCSTHGLWLHLWSINTLAFHVFLLHPCQAEPPAPSAESVNVIRFPQLEVWVSLIHWSSQQREQPSLTHAHPSLQILKKSEFGRQAHCKGTEVRLVPITQPTISKLQVKVFGGYAKEEEVTNQVLTYPSLFLSSSFLVCRFSYVR